MPKTADKPEKNSNNPCRAAMAVGWLCLLGLAWHGFASPAWSAPDYPFFREDYRGDPDRELAFLRGVAITERDLYLFLLMAGLPHPDLAKEWKNQKWSVVAEQRNDEIRRATEYLATLSVLGNRIHPDVSPYLERLMVRKNLFPVYSMVWTDRVVVPGVKVYSEDVLHYIRKNPDRFYLPDRLQFYWAFFPSSPLDSPDRRLAVREKVQGILNRLRESGASLATVAADYAPSTTLKSEAGLFTVTAGASQIDPLVETAVREGRVRQVRNIIETREGFNLVELRARIQSSSWPDRDVQAEADKHLFLEFLPEQYDHRLENLRRTLHPVDRTTLWPFLAEDTILLDVGRTDVTKQDFRELYPAISADDRTLDIATVQAAASEFIRFELVAQDVENQLLDLDENLKRSRPFAQSLLGVTVWAKRFADTFETPTSDAIQEYWQENRSRIYPAQALHYYRLSASLLPSMDTLPDSDQREQIERLYNSLVEFQEETQEVLSAYSPSPISANRGIDTAPILTRWNRRFGQAFSTTFEDLGFRTLENSAAEEFPTPYLELPALSPGEVSAPRYEPTEKLAMYFVTETQDRPDPTSEQIHRLTIEAMKRERMAKLAHEAFRSVVRTGQFRWAPGTGPTQ